MADDLSAEQAAEVQRAADAAERARLNKERRRAAMQGGAGGGFTMKECIWTVQKSVDTDGALLVLADSIFKARCPRSPRETERGRDRRET